MTVRSKKRGLNEVELLMSKACDQLVAHQDSLGKVRKQIAEVVRYCRYREKCSPCCRDVLRLLGLKSGKAETPDDDTDELCSCDNCRPTLFDESKFCANCGMVVKEAQS